MRTCTAILSLGLAALGDARLAGRLATRAAAMRIASHDADERVRGPTMMVLGDLGQCLDLDEEWRPIKELTDESNGRIGVEEERIVTPMVGTLILDPSAEGGRDSGTLLKKIGRSVTVPLADLYADIGYDYATLAVQMNFALV